MEKSDLEEKIINPFNKIARFYDNFLIQLFFNKIHKDSLNFVENYLKENQKILDVGCGTGNFLNKLNKINKNLILFGIDQSEQMINIAKKKFKDINFFQIKAQNLSFEDNFMDFVFIIEAFHHFLDQERVLKEIYRVLKNNGYLFILDPALDNFLFRILWGLSKFTFLEKDSKFLYLKELENLLNKTGFEVIKSKNTMANLMVLAKK